MNKWMSVLGIVLLLGLVAQVSATTATNLVLDYNSTSVDISLKPGDSGILTVVVKNTGGYAAENVEAWIPSTEDIPVNKRWYLGNIEAGSSKTVTTSIRVEEDARVGLHTLQARLTFDGTKSDGSRENSKTVTWDIPLRIAGEANFDVTIPEGEYTENTIQDMSLSIKPRVDVRKVSGTLTSNCASVIGSGKQYLGEMKAGETYAINYEVRPEEVGVCDLSLLLDYSDVSGSGSTENISIGLRVERSSIDLKVVDIEDGNLALGGSSMIKFIIKNLGNTKASDVSVTLNLTSPFTPVKSSQSYVGDIASGESKGAEFTISVDSSAKKKSYSIPVLIEYYDQAGSHQWTGVYTGLGVGGDADIKVSLDEKTQLSPGMNGKVTVGVVNRGFVDAKFMTLNLLSTDYYKVTSASSTYIGALNSDDSDAQEYDIMVYSNVTEDDIPLSVRVEYKEENNDELIVKDESVPVSVTPVSGGGIIAAIFGLISSLIGILILIAIVIGAYLGIWMLIRVLGIATKELDKKVFKKNIEE